MSSNDTSDQSAAAPSHDILENQEFEEECVICLEELTKNSQWGRCTPCDHAYHKVGMGVYLITCTYYSNSISDQLELHLSALRKSSNAGGSGKTRIMSVSIGRGDEVIIWRMPKDLNAVYAIE